MNITQLSIKRPAFITSFMISIITFGFIAFKKMQVDIKSLRFPFIAYFEEYSEKRPPQSST
jgi:multidrug efflux pump subunit AcrB